MQKMRKRLEGTLFVMDIVLHCLPYILPFYLLVAIILNGAK